MPPGGGGGGANGAIGGPSPSANGGPNPDGPLTEQHHMLRNNLKPYNSETLQHNRHQQQQQQAPPYGHVNQYSTMPIMNGGATASKMLEAGVSSGGPTLYQTTTLSTFSKRAGTEFTC